MRNFCAFCANFSLDGVSVDINIDTNKFAEGALYCVVISFLVGFIVYLVVVGYKHVSGIQSGYVIRKEWSAETTSYSTTCQKDKMGHDTSCISTATHYPPHYYLYFKDGTNQNWADVPYDVWKDFQVGHWYDGNCICDIPK